MREVKVTRAPGHLAITITAVRKEAIRKGEGPVSAAGASTLAAASTAVSDIANNRLNLEIEERSRLNASREVELPKPC